MSELSTEARRLLDAGHRAQTPTAAQRERLRARIGHGAPPPEPRVAAWPRRATWWALLAAGVALLAVLVVARRRPAPTPPRRTHAVVAPPTVAPVPAPPTPPTPPATPAPPAPSAAPLVQRPRPATARPVDTLGEELRILREARHALERGDAAEALRHVRAHAQRFPRGQLTEEREATRVLVLCAAGDRASARRSAEAFVRRYPSSPQLPRVRRSCAFEGGAP